MIWQDTMINTIPVRVENNGLYFLSYFYFSLYLFSYLKLRVRISIISYICNKGITYIKMWSHIL